jgi:hypothetical protein
VEGEMRDTHENSLGKPNESDLFGELILINDGVRMKTGLD